MAGESKKGAVGERRLISADLEDLRIKTTCWAFGHWAVDLPRNQGRKAWSDNNTSVLSHFSRV